MVQDPDSAKYKGMPDSAIATGLADYVRPPEELPEALVDYVKGPYLELVGRPVPELPDDAIHRVLVRLRARTGHDFTNYKRNTMARRIQRRMAVHRIEEPGEYLRYLKEHPGELDDLLHELLISVTSFFRDPEAWDTLAEKAVPELLQRHADDKPVRVWVPGCATGEEAYSAAILFDEQVRKLGLTMEVQVFATDLDAEAIDTARQGVYPEGIAQDVSAERLERYFAHEDTMFRVHKTIRDKVVFAVQNVLSDPPFSQIDLIICRNLLIYLDPAAQHQVLSAFHYALCSGGLLFLGTSETPGEAGRLFETLDAKSKLLRRKDTAEAVYPVRTGASRPKTTQPEAAPQPQARATQRQLARRIEKLLLTRFCPVALVVDAEDTVVYIHGRSGKYFEPEEGAPRNDIIEMARRGLRSVLSAALRKARDTGEAVTFSNVRVQSNGGANFTDLTVGPVDPAGSLGKLLLVTISPTAPPESGEVEQESDASAYEAGEKDRLERELQHTRENLQATIEELETSNEELQSSNEELRSMNEELQSTNEELETSQEEMQSLNEELNTVNAELESKVEALTRARDDMNNLLNSMRVGTIFLDNELRVKRYTEQAREMFHLIESDVGRPLSDLTSDLRYDNLLEDCRDVLANLTATEKEIRDEDNHWFLVRVMPYRTADNVIDGVVITVVNIDRIKQAEASAGAAQADSKFFESIVQTIRQPLIVLDGNLRVVTTNTAFHQTFRTREEEIEGQHAYELGNGQWDIPELRNLLEEVLPENEIMTDFRVEHDFPWIGQRTFLLNARRLELPGGAEDLILLVFEDVTENAE